MSHSLANAPVSPSDALASDLAFLGTLPPDHFSAFCQAARSLLRNPSDTAMFRKAAKQLGTDVSTVSSSVHALARVLADAAVTGRSAGEILDGIDAPLPEASRDALAAFYDEALPSLRDELSRGLEVPRYRGLEWRLQVQLAGRYAPRHPIKPSFLMRLSTRSGGTDKEQLLQADMPNMRRLATELEAALAEEKSSHSRRLARRL